MRLMSDEEQLLRYQIDMAVVNLRIMRKKLFEMCLGHDEGTCKCRCGHVKSCRDCGFYGDID